MASAGPTGGERALGGLAYVGPLVVVPLVVRAFAFKQSRFLAYHTRQGLYLFGIAAAAFLVTLGLLFLFQKPVPVEALFLFLSVVLLLELVLYGAAVVALVIMTAIGRMPMVPVIGDMAGER